MVVLNRMDRFQLALDVVRRVPRLNGIADRATQRFTEMMQKHKLLCFGVRRGHAGSSSGNGYRDKERVDANAIFVMNSGSSSLKFGVLAEGGGRDARRSEGRVESARYGAVCAGRWRGLARREGKIWFAGE